VLGKVWCRTKIGALIIRIESNEETVERDFVVPTEGAAAASI